MNTVPNRISKWMAVTLLSVISAATTAGQDTALMNVTQPQPAGCHHRDGAPSSRPVSYRCCQSGHDSAILQIPLTMQMDSSDLRLPVELSPVLATGFRQSLRSLAISSPDPPLNLPLRV